MVISSNPGQSTRGTGPLYTQSRQQPQARKPVSSYADGRGAGGPSRSTGSKRPGEGASTALMSYRHPTLFWHKERLCCEYVLSLPSSELAPKLVSGPTPPYFRGEPRISALVLLGSPGSGCCTSGPQAAAATARGPSGATVKPRRTPARSCLRPFGPVGPSCCLARRTTWPQNGPHMHATLPQTAAYRPALISLPCTSLLCPIPDGPSMRSRLCMHPVSNLGPPAACRP